MQSLHIRQPLRIIYSQQGRADAHVLRRRRSGGHGQGGRQSGVVAVLDLALLGGLGIGERTGGSLLGGFLLQACFFRLPELHIRHDLLVIILSSQRLVGAVRPLGMASVPTPLQGMQICRGVKRENEGLAIDDDQTIGGDNSNSGHGSNLHRGLRCENGKAFARGRASGVLSRGQLRLAKRDAP